MSIYIDVPRAYFEMARAISNVLNVEMSKWKKELPDVNGEQMANIQFSLVSTIIIQCYMTIEAFTNEGLKKLWDESRKREGEFNKIKNSGVQEAQNAKSLYQDFYDKYGYYENFEDLRFTKLKDLGERIKIICKTLEISQIHESDEMTWTFFKRIEKEYRHYLIHIYPENEKFYNLVNDIIRKNELGKYFNTVNNIISHFYIQKDSNPPEWLKDNTLYNFSGIDYL